MRKKKALPKLGRAEKVNSATAPFHGELNARETNHALKMLKLLRVKVLSFFKFCLSALQRSFHCTFVDLLFTDGMFGQNADAVAFDLRETAGYCQPLGLPVLRHTQLSFLHLSEQRNVSGKNTDLALDRGDHHRIDCIGIHP